MTLSTPHGRLVITIILLLSIIVSIIPIPELLTAYRLQLVAMVLIYWCIALPERVGVGTAFICGICMDILTGTLLGQHAMSLSVVAFISIKGHQRVRVFPIWQQAIFVMLLLLLDRVLMLWVDGSIGLPDKDPVYWAAPLLGGVLWPWLFIVLRDLRRRFSVR